MKGRKSEEKERELIDIHFHNNCNNFVMQKFVYTKGPYFHNFSMEKLIMRLLETKVIKKYIFWRYFIWLEKFSEGKSEEIVCLELEKSEH